MSFALRPARLPEEYPAIATLLSAASYAPVTAAQVAEEDGYLPENGIRFRTMAVEESGGVVAFGEGFRYPTTLPGKFYITVVTAPAERGRGIGSALMEAILGQVRRHGATLLSCQVQESDQRSLAYLNRRGWEVRRHGYDSVLDLSRFDANRFVPEVAVARTAGIRFASLAEAPGEHTERSLYQMLSEAMPDIPGNDGQGFMAYETFRRWALGGEGFRPDLNILAADGDRVVGATLQSLRPGETEVYTVNTSVLRGYRGRKIALALKVLGLTAAKGLGATRARTGNDSLNGPMLAVNRKLGYQPVAGSYELVRRLD